MNLKNIANHLLGILRKKKEGGPQVPELCYLIYYYYLLFFLKNPLKTKSIVKMFLCFFFEKKQNKTKKPLTGFPYLLKPFVFPKMP